MTQLVDTRNLFVSTESVTNGNSLDTTFFLPQGLMSCDESQRMRLSLLTFSMRQNWYNINQYNNRFYLVAVDAVGVILSSALVTIARGNYSSYDNSVFGLTVALETAMGTALTAMGITGHNVAVVWDSVTGKLQMTYDASSQPTYINIKHLAFTINNYTSSGGSLVQDIIGTNNVTAYQDVFEILGGCKNVKNEVSVFSELKDIFDTTFVANAMTATSYWGASLNTMENIYIRTNLNNTSFQSAGFDTGSSKYPDIVSSNILAKIPIGNNNFAYQTDTVRKMISQEQSKVIYYTDNGNNLFSMYLQTKQQTSMRLYVTDAYGRPLSIESPEQLSCNGMYWTATMRIDVYG